MMMGRSSDRAYNLAVWIMLLAPYDIMPRNTVAPASPFFLAK